METAMETAVNEATEIAQYLTFHLAEETYAMDVVQIREVLELLAITKIPRAPEYMRGVINVRGGAVPVIDMRLRFDMPPQETTIDTCIIVLEVVTGQGALVLGALVDSVEEVIELAPSEIEPPPDIGTGLNAAFIKGMGRRDERFVIILDANRIFDTAELGIIEDAKRLAPAAEAAGAAADKEPAGGD